MVCSISSGIPQSPSGGGSIAAPILAWPSVMMSMNALRSMASAKALRSSALSKGGLSRLTRRLVVPLLVASTHFALGHDVDERLAVDGQRQGLAQLGIVERRLVAVDQKVGGAVIGRQHTLRLRS